MNPALRCFVLTLSLGLAACGNDDAPTSPIVPSNESTETFESIDASSAELTSQLDASLWRRMPSPGPTPTLDDTVPSILEIYYGLDSLPRQASLFCRSIITGQDGVPVTFSAQLEANSISPEDFLVETATGEFVVPDCATLNPANEALELRTVLLTGTFGTAHAQLRAVEVVGIIEDLNGNEITGLRSENVTRLEEGPGLVLAERFLPTNPGLAGECPEWTTQIVQIVWGGGVTGPNGAALGEDQRLGISIGLEDGTIVQPIALGDDDPDNFVCACLDAESPAMDVRVDADLFFDPGDDANPATTASVIDRVR